MCFPHVEGYHPLRVARRVSHICEVSGRREGAREGRAAQVSYSEANQGMSGASLHVVGSRAVDVFVPYLERCTAHRDSRDVCSILEG